MGLSDILGLSDVIGFIELIQVSMDFLYLEWQFQKKLLFMIIYISLENIYDRI